MNAIIYTYFRSSIFHPFVSQKFKEYFLNSIDLILNNFPITLRPYLILYKRKLITNCLLRILWKFNARFKKFLATVWKLRKISISSVHYLPLLPTISPDNVRVHVKSAWPRITVAVCPLFLVAFAPRTAQIR